MGVIKMISYNQFKKNCYNWNITYSEDDIKKGYKEYTDFMNS